MNRVILAIALAAPLAACRVTPPADPATSTAVGARATHISGAVVDMNGKPVKARVALISDTGSQSTGTGNGKFEFNGLRFDEYVSKAWTDDGKWSVLPRVVPGERELRLTPDRAGAYVDVSMTGRSTARFAVFHDGLRFADQTVRDGETKRFLVPAGASSCMLYGSDLERAQELHLGAGETEALSFGLAE